MKLLRALLVLLLALGLQVALGKLWTGSLRYFDLLAIPVIWYAMVGSQRSALFAGCVAGLLQDAWFQVGVFGLNGFKKTLLGWGLGGLSSRFDLNSPAGRLAGGMLFSLSDSLLDPALRRLIDLESATPGALEILARALVTGLLIGPVFSMTARLRDKSWLKRWT